MILYIRVLYTGIDSKLFSLHNDHKAEPLEWQAFTKSSRYKAIISLNRANLFKVKV